MSLMSVKRKLILDVDTGIDDALALAYVSTFDDVELLGSIGTYGNVTADTAVRNTRYVLDWLGLRHVPVLAGSTHPSWADSFIADAGCAQFHGTDGLGGFGPCGIKLAGAYVFDVVHEIHRNVHGAPVIGCAKMYGYLFGDKGFSCHLLLLLRCYPTEGESVMLLSELFLGCMPPYSGRGIRSMGCTVFTPAKMGIFMSLMV